MNPKEAISIYKDFLKTKGLLYTKPRDFILKMALSSKWHFSADELTDKIHSRGKNIGRATVYRTLASMKEAGLLNIVDLGHGHIHYEPMGIKEQHEHITCEKCGAICEINVKSLKKVLNLAAKKVDFSNVKYTIRLSGLCDRCSNFSMF